MRVPHERWGQYGPAAWTRTSLLSALFRVRGGHIGGTARADRSPRDFIPEAEAGEMPGLFLASSPVPVRGLLDQPEPLKSIEVTAQHSLRAGVRERENWTQRRDVSARDWVLLFREGHDEVQLPTFGVRFRSVGEHPRTYSDQTLWYCCAQTNLSCPVSDSGGDVIPFLLYAVRGFVDGIIDQITGERPLVRLGKLVQPLQTMTPSEWSGSATTAPAGWPWHGSVA